MIDRCKCPDESNAYGSVAERAVLCRKCGKVVVTEREYNATPYPKLINLHAHRMKIIEEEEKEND